MSELLGRVRQLRHDPAYVAVVLLSLGIGMAACVSAFSLVNTLVFAPIPGIADRSELVRIAWRDATPLTPLEFETIEGDAGTVFARVAAQGDRAVSVQLPSGPAVVPAAFVSPSFFQTLGTRAVAGRLLAPADAEPSSVPVVLIAESLWRTAFGADPGILGRPVSAGGRAFAIVGVTPDRLPGLRMSDVGQKASSLPQVWIPLRFARAWGGSGEPNAPWLAVAGRLREGVALRPAQSQIELLGQRARSRSKTNRREAALVAMRAGLEWRDAPWESALVIAVYLFVPFAVLAIGCTNVVNLQLARAAERAGELSIRLALGASRARIMRLLSIDVALLAGVAGVLGWAGARAVLSAAQAFFPHALAIDGRVLTFAILVVVGVVSVAGTVPAWLAARDVVAPGLRDIEGTSPAHARLRAALVIAQVAASVALLAISGLALRSLDARLPAPPAHASTILVAELNLADTRTPASRSGLFAREVLDRLSAAPSVEAVACATFIAYGSPVRYWQAGDAEDRPRIAYGGLITAGWLNAADAILLAGRPPRTFGNQSAEVLVSASLAAQLAAAGGTALGVPLRIRHPLDGSLRTVEVAGVLADNLASADGRPVPGLYVPMSPEMTPPWHVLLVRARGPAMLEDARLATRSAASAVDPAIPFVALQTLDSRLADLGRGFRAIALFGFALGGVALALAGAGLYALTAFTMRRRTREIGVRLAVGARPQDIMMLALRASTTLAVIGTSCGLAIAFPLARGMRAVLVGVSPLDPSTILPTIALLVVVSVVAALIPAYRAASIDPIETLRESR